MTTVSVPAADLRRSVSPDMFADITDTAPVFGGEGGEFTVSFGTVFDDATVARIRDRLITSGDDQETARQVLAGHLAALRDPGADPDLYSVLADTLAYLLGGTE